MFLVMRGKTYPIREEDLEEQNAMGGNLKVERVLTAEEVAAHLQLNIRTIYRLLESGELKGRKIGRVWRIAESAVSEFMAGNESDD